MMHSGKRCAKDSISPYTPDTHSKKLNLECLKLCPIRLLKAYSNFVQRKMSLLYAYCRFQGVTICYAKLCPGSSFSNPSSVQRVVSWSTLTSLEVVKTPASQTIVVC